jgi:hypothetical protein
MRTNCPRSRNTSRNPFGRNKMKENIGHEMAFQRDGHSSEPFTFKVVKLTILQLSKLICYSRQIDHFTINLLSNGGQTYHLTQSAALTQNYYAYHHKSSEMFSTKCTSINFMTWHGIAHRTTILQIRNPPR